ncbi:type IV pilin protein [Dokdonella fugitiva]|jgi:type IV pilus assembly protein PilE|uniref:Type IV pilus assembly protein PilE n=1 Tax=Dokdonella fugitiva TaxID=328517 RepID=A0A4R2ICK0_9GAMM|nr:type IV pilin protein [Dokdonella fugitiva]MBA8883878.1 type IV pilus assembly protein PilE [Dokdonella fugitiva]TCO41866.1 type IV pilus assembly protein PilE [Dokdonella fugitiva]
MNRKVRGFTLIELVVVVAIVAILAMISYPSYRNYVLRAHRADGKELAMRIAAAEERFFTNRNRYTNDITGATGLNMQDVSEKGYYKASVQTGNGDQTFVLTLDPQGMQVPDKCKKLTINNTGFKDKTGDESNGKCW